jgi:uncharacterized membrane protein
MELFLAQYHSALTHLPIAAAILGAAAAVVALFVDRREVGLAWASLAIVAFVTVMPALITGIAAAKGRFNDEGKPYIGSGILVSGIEANTRIYRHQMLGISGAGIAAVLTVLGIARLRGRNPNKYVVALLAVLLAVLWGIGGDMGGREMWGPGTFPALQ